VPARGQGAFGVPASNRIRAGKTPGSGLEALLPSTHGQGFAPKKAGLLVR
jgi:hypothetical protein